MYHATLGPHDFLFLPARWLCSELVLSKFDIMGHKVSIIPSQANVREAFPCMHAMDCKEQTLDEVGRLMSLAKKDKLTHDPGVAGGATLALSGPVRASEVKDH